MKMTSGSRPKPPASAARPRPSARPPSARKGDPRSIGVKFVKQADIPEDETSEDEEVTDEMLDAAYTR